MKRSSQTLTADTILRNESPIFVNRAIEDFELPFHAHDFIELAFVAEGRGYHHIEDEVHPVFKGQLFILPVGVSHVFRPASVESSKHPLVVYNCVFTSETLQVLSRLIRLDHEIQHDLQMLLSGTTTWHSVWDQHGELEKLMISLYQEYALPQTGSTTYLITLLLQLFVEAYRLRTAAEAGPVKLAALGDSYFTQVLQYMETNYASSITLASLAEQCQWSERQLQRLFKQYTGQTFRGYLQNVRIQKSCELLRSTSHKISSIAEAVGYKDMDSFLEVFKKIVGLTPNELRQQSRHMASPK